MLKPKKQNLSPSNVSHYTPVVLLSVRGQGAKVTVLELESDSTVTLNVVDVFSSTSYHIAYHLLQNLNLCN